MALGDWESKEELAGGLKTGPSLDDVVVQVGWDVGSRARVGRVLLRLAVCVLLAQTTISSFVPTTDPEISLGTPVGELGGGAGPAALAA